MFHSVFAGYELSITSNITVNADYHYSWVTNNPLSEFEQNIILEEWEGRKRDCFVLSFWYLK